MLFQDISGTPVANILCGKDTFDITQDKSLHSYLNRSSLFTAKLGNCSFGSIVGLLIKSSINSSDTKVVVKSTPGFSSDLKNLLDIIENSDQAKVQVLEDKPDEISDNKPKEAKLTAEALRGYQEKMKKFSNTYESAVNLSENLLRTDPPKSMWGVKDIKAYLAKMKTSPIEMNNNKEAFEIAAEQTDFRLSNVTSCLNNKIANSNLKRIISDSVNHTVTNFLTMKKMMTSFLHSFHNLYASDAFFKKSTGYPATWFFDPSVFYNFTERYEDVSENLVEATKAESSVIRPLYAWKNKVTGDI